MLKRAIISLTIGLLVALATMWGAGLVRAQDTGVYAEAKEFANIRAAIGLEAEVVGQIEAGTRYPVLARSQFFPWLLLGTPDTFEPLGWVFQDLVNISGDIFTLPLSENSLAAQGVIATPEAFPTSTIAGVSAPPTSTLGTPVDTSAAPLPSSTPNFNIYALVNGEINLRYGPGADYPRLGVALPGERLQIVGYHTTLDWVQVSYPSAPNGVAWVSRGVVDIIGNANTTNPISQTDFSNQPTLTPTPALVIQPVNGPDGEAVEISPEFAALANGMWNRVITSGFDPITTKFAGLYVHDLTTGEEFAAGNNVAFNGTSVNKIAVLAGFFNALEGQLDYQTAVDLANTMICSENVATNNVISRIGGGDMYRGSEAITSFLTQLGLTRTFLTAPYETPGRDLPEPTIPIRFPRTDVDQVRAEPNVTNQMTVGEMGYLLKSIYECAYEESGPLLTNFTSFTPQECRKMLYIMANNTVDAFIKTGTPDGTTVAHKHGWVANTHGNAGIAFTPGGDYIMVIMMYQPEWLVFNETFALSGNLSRDVYNYLNPEAPLEAVREGFTPPTETCNYAGSELVEQLASPYFLENLEFPASSHLNQTTTNAAADVTPSPTPTPTMTPSPTATAQG